MTIDPNEFAEMRADHEAFEQKREELILKSRQLLQKSKKALYHVHRDEMADADAILKEAGEIAEAIKDACKNDDRLKIGAASAALQEWVETVAYYVYMKDGSLIKRDDVGVETEDYLLAIADLTGELTRRAVLASIKQDRKTVEKLRAFVDELHGEFLSFSFRNGELRKKTDQVRWNLQKIEELLVKR